MTYDILATGSSGNAVVINGEILIDCGVSMKRLRDSGYIKSLKLVLLTHEHGDHFNAATVRALHKERPTLRFGCCEWMVPHLLDAGVDKLSIHKYELGSPHFYTLHNAMTFSIRPFALIHDVQTCGYVICKHGEKLLYATDTSTLDHIEAKNYDYYLIEANHTRAEIEARIAEKQARGEFAYETRAAQNHLSQEQDMEWLVKNISPERWNSTEIVFLHAHRERGEK